MPDRLAEPRYAVVIEAGNRYYSAAVLVLPECIVTGESEATVTRPMSRAIDLHVAGGRAGGAGAAERGGDDRGARLRIGAD